MVGKGADVDLGGTERFSEEATTTDEASGRLGEGLIRNYKENHPAIQNKPLLIIMNVL